MANYIISCCSTADLSKQHFNSRDIHYVCFHYIIDGFAYSDDLGQTIPFDEFYQKIEDGAMPTTSQVNVAEFTDYFRQFLDDGKDIFHVSLSSGISGAYGSAQIAAKALREEYPDRKIIVVDSLGASSGYGLLMDTLADLRDSGKTIDELKEFAEKNRLNLHHWFFSTNLAHYLRGGRISRASAVFGTVLKICPLMNMDTDGLLIPRKKIRSKKAVINAIVNEMEQHAENGLEYCGKCYISNSNCYDDAKKVAELIESRFKSLNGKVEINNIGTVIGSHTGPGTVALYFFGDNRVK